MGIYSLFQLSDFSRVSSTINKRTERLYSKTNQCYQLIKFDFVENFHQKPGRIIPQGRSKKWYSTSARNPQDQQSITLVRWKTLVYCKTDTWLPKWVTALRKLLEGIMLMPTTVKGFFYLPFDQLKNSRLSFL